MNSQADLPNLAMALEYADLGAALYLAGGSDHAARLLAAAAEEVLGDLAKLLGPHAHSDEVQTLLARVALRYQAPPLDTRMASGVRPSQLGLLDEDYKDYAEQRRSQVRSATASYLRAAWYTLEAMGLEAVIPQRLQKAVDHSTIYL